MRLVRQRATYDCGLCCLAMVTGHPYNSLRMEFDIDFNSTGIFLQELLDALHRLGYFTRVMKHHMGKRPRITIHPWPPKLSLGTFVLEMSLNSNRPGGHFAAMHDGKLYDPAGYNHTYELVSVVEIMQPNFVKTA